MFDHFAFAWECCAPKGKAFSLVSIRYLDTYIKAFAKLLSLPARLHFQEEESVMGYLTQISRVV